MRCPTCKRETEIEGNLFRPFCSERCQLIDLESWLEGRYRFSSPISSGDQKASVAEDGGASEADLG